MGIQHKQKTTPSNEDVKLILTYERALVAPPRLPALCNVFHAGA